MSSEGPGQPLPPPRPEDPRWPPEGHEAERTGSVPVQATATRAELGAVDATPSDGGHGWAWDVPLDDEYPPVDTTGELHLQPHPRRIRTRPPHAATLGKLILSVLLPGLLLFLGLYFIATGLVSGDEEQPASRADVDSAYVPTNDRVEVSGDPAAVAAQLARTFLGMLDARSWDTAAGMTKGRWTAGHLQDVFPSERAADLVQVRDVPTGRERYGVRIALVDLHDDGDGADVWCVQLDVVPTGGFVNPTDVQEISDAVAERVGSQDEPDTDEARVRQWQQAAAAVCDAASLSGG